jgi:rhodanese-related sulfurtransferase
VRRNFAFVNGPPVVADRLTSQARRRTFWSGGAMGKVEHRSRIDDLLADARADLDRVAPTDLAAEMAAGALVVDTRPEEQRRRDGELPGAVVIDRNVLEWRLDPTSPHRIPEADGADRRVIVVCDQGFSSSLAAATLRRLGVRRATDLAGGYQAWRQRLPGPRRTLDDHVRQAAEGAPPRRPGV